MVQTHIGWLGTDGCDSPVCGSEPESDPYRYTYSFTNAITFAVALADTVTNSIPEPLPDAYTRAEPIAVTNSGALRDQRA